MIENLTKGEPVILTCDGEQYLSTVSLASANGKSLVLVFNAMIDGHVGMMPVLGHDDGSYTSLITGKEIKLRRPSGSAEITTLRQNEK